MDFLHKSLSNKRILLGVSGGIAAYKSAELIRLLRQNGAQVRVVMTEAAQQFITAISLQALSGEAVRSNSFDAAAEAAMGHIELARWADALLIAPATADLIVRLSQGQADDLLSTLALATQSPAVLCPAMNSVMWQQASTQAALETLQQRDWQIVAPTSGDLACGEVGVGRLAELPEIVASLAQLFAPQSLAGVRLAVSAAASREYLDPVRYLSNASSGKMGYAIATAAVEAGAQTTLLSGPCAQPVPERLHEFVAFTSAEDLDTQLQQRQDELDIFIACAAIADYRATSISPRKSGKQEQVKLDLVATVDTLANFSRRRRPGQLVIGFAAQSEDLASQAEAKLKNKDLDMICANRVGSGTDQGIGSDNNELLLLYRDGSSKHLPLADKNKLARQLIADIAELYASL